MNKRIANKIHTGHARYEDSYTEAQLAEAQRVSWRHGPLGYTERVMNRMVDRFPRDDANPHGDRTSMGFQRAVVKEWRALRPFLVARCNQSRIADKPWDSIKMGDASAPEEIARNRDDEENWPGIAEFAWGSLCYFSDRWCASRVGRMDTFVRVLEAEIRMEELNHDV